MQRVPFVPLAGILMLLFAITGSAILLFTPQATLAQTTDPIFVGAGDIADCTGTGDSDTANLLDTITGTVFTLGDNAYTNGTNQEFQDCYDPTWGRHKARTKPAPGNHDYNTSGAAGYYTYFGAAASPLDSNCTVDCKGYYAYNLGAWHIIVLNSEIEMTPGSPQDQWLQADLAANTSVCTLAYWHKPRFSSGEHGDDTSVQPLWDALYAHGVDVILNGHDHDYERFDPQDPNGQADPTHGIREFVVGTGGRSLRTFPSVQPNSVVQDATTWGVIKFTLHATSYDWEFLPVAGQSFTDHGSANCVSDTAPPVTPGSPTATPRPGATLTPSATPTTPQSGLQTLVLTPSEGWDDATKDLLSEVDGLAPIQTSDDSHWPTTADSFTAFEFGANLPSPATILSVKVQVEHYEDKGLVANELGWEIGSGKLKKPKVLHSGTITTEIGITSEAKVGWEVATWVNTPKLANDLKLVIRNHSIAQSAWLDQVSVVVTYWVGGEPPPVTLQGQVALEGRPGPPHPQWVLPLTVNLQGLAANPLTRTAVLTTNMAGQLTMTGIPAGLYHVQVKGEHTLQRVVTATLQVSTTTVNVGLLREGDAVNDNRINILDFSQLSGSFAQCTGNVSFVGNADFNQDGCVNAQDVALLTQNFGLSGESAISASTNTRSTTPLGAITAKQAGDRFTIILRVHNPDNAPFDAAALYVNFDPLQLEASRLVGSPVLPVQLVQHIDNMQGQVAYAAGLLGASASGTPDLVAITFTVRKSFKSTLLSLAVDIENASLVAYHGQALNLAGGTESPVEMQEIAATQELFLPTVTNAQ